MIDHVLDIRGLVVQMSRISVVFSLNRWASSPPPQLVLKYLKRNETWNSSTSNAEKVNYASPLVKSLVSFLLLFCVSLVWVYTPVFHVSRPLTIVDWPIIRGCY